MITQSKLKNQLLYVNGVFYWKITKGNRAHGSVAGCLNISNGYRSIFIDGYAYREHRLAFLYVFNLSPKYIDHIDGNSSNNRIENLRECTQRQNCQNRVIKSDNMSGVKGVGWHKGRWRARINIKNKQIHIGYFDEIKDAEGAVRLARIKHHGEFANHG